MSILDNIVEYKKQEVLIQKKSCELKALIEQIGAFSGIRNFENVLKKFKQLEKTVLIAEVKKASPSKGVIRADFDPVEIAKTYQKSGASAVSVLTDTKFFQGSIDYLKNVRKNIELPVLRKDFIVDEYQIYQTKAMQADIILLIASVLDDKQLKDFYVLSRELGLDVLLEVHNKEEYERAMALNANIIGINNRNLKTFEVSLQNTINLIKEGIPENTYIISESGIKTSSDVKLLTSYGVNGILVGESLLKNKNIATATLNLLK